MAWICAGALALAFAVGPAPPQARRAAVLLIDVRGHQHEASQLDAKAVPPPVLTVRRSDPVDERLDRERGPAPKDWRQRARPWAFAALGVGFAAMVTGIALLAIDDQEVSSQCSGGNVDDDGDCRMLYNTVPLGAAFAAGGAALAATGGTLLVVTQPGTKRRHRHKAQLRPTLLGLRGWF